MAPGTRSRPGANKKKAEPEARNNNSTTRKLEASEQCPPQLFVLPRDVSPTACITTIPNPASLTPARYFVCPHQGFYEFTRVAVPKRQQKSWLLAPNRRSENRPGADSASGVGTQGADDVNDTGYVLQTADMFVATPIDPLFLLIPSLAGDMTRAGQEYQASSDYTTKLGESSPHFSQMLQADTAGTMERHLEHRIAAVCDNMEIGDEKMYALSLPKLVKELVFKAKRMVARGLPESMEDRFIRQALDVPVLSIMREESSISIATQIDAGVNESDSVSTNPSQAVNTLGSSTEAVSTAATCVSMASATASEHLSDEVARLLRLRVALEFLLASYVAPSMRSKLQPSILDTTTSGVDFSALDHRLQEIAKLKKDAQALRSLSDNVSRKRSAMEDDEEAMEMAEAKKRKREEEESRKKNVSHGVKKLLKADTSGMKKLSSFFSKPTIKKK